MQRRARLRRRLRRAEARVHVRHVPLPPRPRGPRVHGRVRALSTWMLGARRVRCRELQMQRWVRRGRLLGARPRAPPAALTLALSPSPHPRPTTQVPIVEAAGGGGASVHVGRPVPHSASGVAIGANATSGGGRDMLTLVLLQARCTRDAAEMRVLLQARCTRDAAEMRARCTRDAAEIRARYTPDMSSRSRSCRWALRWGGARAVSTMSRPISIM